MKRAKICSTCGETKSVKAFSKNHWAKDKLQSSCKSCKFKSHRTWKLKNVFGLTLSGYEKLLKEQGGCKICGGTDEPEKQLAVDHDHKTGKVRGLLCQKCNQGIGSFKDSPELLLAAAAYLQKTF